MEKPEEPPSGFKEERQQAAGSSSHTLSFYCILRLIARAEACSFAIDPNSLPMVRVDLLYLSRLL